MTQALTTVGGTSAALPALFAPSPAAGKRYVEFFTANIRNSNTRKAYARAAVDFAAWCDLAGLTELRDIEPVHVAAYVETLQLRLSAPSVKLHFRSSDENTPGGFDKLEAVGGLCISRPLQACHFLLERQFEMHPFGKPFGSNAVGSVIEFAGIRPGDRSIGDIGHSLAVRPL